MAGAATGRPAWTATALALATVLVQACAPTPPEPISRDEQALVFFSGGIYRDPAVGAYVRGVGQRLVEAAGQPAGDWQFLVLDTPGTNAFTLPGNRVYVTRGMLTLANDAAELGSVLAHELGHAISADGTRPASEAERRASEFRADSLGMGYLERAGYDAGAQPDFLRTFLRYQRLSSELAGDPAAETAGPGHPALADRLAIAEREAAGAPPGRRDRAAYLAAIDGLVWGNGPAQGFVSGGRFIHPFLGFTFESPRGYVLENRPDAVVAAGPRGGLFLLDSVRDPGGTPADYLADDWVPEIGEEVRAEAITGLRETDVNGLPAAQGRVLLHSERSERVADLTVVRLNGRLYRLAGLHQANDAASEALLAAVTASFRALSRPEARSARPRHLKVHRIAAGEDVAALVAAMPVPAPRATFEVLNGLQPGKVLRVGDEIKLVVP